MDWFDEEKELEKFIKKYDIVPTYSEKIILKLAMLHGAIVYNEHNIKEKYGEK